MNKLDPNKIYEIKVDNYETHIVIDGEDLTKDDFQIAMRAIAIYTNCMARTSDIYIESEKTYWKFLKIVNEMEKREKAK